MGSTIAGIVTVVVLSAWHLRTRRHPNWSVSSYARFYISLGYPMVAIAVFWLIEAPAATDWEWALGNLWALAAMVSFVYGFNALNTVPARQRQPNGAGGQTQENKDLPIESSRRSIYVCARRRKREHKNHT